MWSICYEQVTIGSYCNGQKVQNVRSQLNSDQIKKWKSSDPPKTNDSAPTALRPTLASNARWDQCRVKDLYKDDILTHINQPQHILDDPKTWAEFECPFILYGNPSFGMQPFILYDDPFHPFTWGSSYCFDVRLAPQCLPHSHKRSATKDLQNAGGPPRWTFCGCVADIEERVWPTHHIITVRRDAGECFHLVWRPIVSRWAQRLHYLIMVQKWLVVLVF